MASGAGRQGAEGVCRAGQCGHGAGRRAWRTSPITAIPELLAFVQREDIYFTVVGPEAPLAAGVVDAFRAAGLKIFGPTKAAAQLESSKDFAKRFMMRHNIPTAFFETFSDIAGRMPMSRNTARPS